MLPLLHGLELVGCFFTDFSSSERLLGKDVDAGAARKSNGTGTSGSSLSAPDRAPRVPGPPYPAIQKAYLYLLTSRKGKCWEKVTRNRQSGDQAVLSCEWCSELVSGLLTGWVLVFSAFVTSLLLKTINAYSIRPCFSQEQSRCWMTSGSLLPKNGICMWIWGCVSECLQVPANLGCWLLNWNKISQLEMWPSLCQTYTGVLSSLKCTLWGTDAFQVSNNAQWLHNFFSPQTILIFS